MKAKSFLKLLGMICVVAVAATCADAQPITLANVDFPPFSFEENGQAKGISNDLVAEAMRRAGYDVKVITIPWARALNEARVGTIDGLTSAFKTAEREKYLDYSHEALIHQEIQLFVPSDSTLTFDGNLSTLANQSIVAVNQVSYGPIFDAAARNGTLKYVVAANSELSSIRMLMANRANFMVSSHSVALWTLKKANLVGKIRPLSSNLDDLVAYVAFTKARDLSQLRAAFDAALVAMKADGTYDRIVATYEK